MEIITDHTLVYPNTTEGVLLLDRIKTMGIRLKSFGVGHDPHFEPEFITMNGENLVGYNSIGNYLDNYQSHPQKIQEPPVPHSP